MVILSLMVTPIFFVNTANDAAALLFARGADFISVLDKAQRAAFVMVFLNLHHQLDLAWMLWGSWFIPFGLLVYRSRFLPRILGAWLIVICFAYLALSFTGLLFPAYEDKVWRFAQPVAQRLICFQLAAQPVDLLLEPRRRPAPVRNLAQHASGWPTSAGGRARALSAAACFSASVIASRSVSFARKRLVPVQSY